MATAGTERVGSDGHGVVSVIVPAYNAARFIRKSVASALDQTYPAVEIIVVNDGSTDDTQAIVETEFGGRVRLVNQTNGGLANARNAGIHAATGRYVAFLDADDWWDPRKIEVQVRALRESPEATATYTGLALISQETGARRDSAPIDATSLWPLLRWCNPGIVPSSVMMERETLTRLGGFTEGLRACEDWDLWFKVVRSGRFVTTAEPLTFYLVSPGGLSGNADHMFDSFLQILDPLLLDGFAGKERARWRKKILSYQAYKSCLTARGAGDTAKERAYMWRSLREWPSPFWAPERFKAFAFTLLRG